MRILDPSQAAISQAAQTLKDGLLVAFPTETVYGLGASAVNPEALARLYAAKGRPKNHPVIIHLAGVEMLDKWASHVPDAALRLARALWPGPLTLILPRSQRTPDAVTGGQNTVGLRVPNHPVALELLKTFADGVAAPSANKFGRLSPTTAQAVAADFGDEVEIILDGGECDVGIESTIVDFSTDEPRILRPGMIVPEQIEEIAQVSIQGMSRTASKTRAPGGLPSHYAPHTPLETVASEELSSRIDSLMSEGKRVCVLAFQGPRISVAWIVAPPNPHRYARQLYSSLRALDQERADVIIVEIVPNGSDWEGIADRLRRASAVQGSNGDNE